MIQRQMRWQWYLSKSWPRPGHPGTFLLLEGQSHPKTGRGEELKVPALLGRIRGARCSFSSVLSNCPARKAMKRKGATCS